MFAEDCFEAPRAMAKKARQRISYVLENAKSSDGGHRLGVNGLAVDSDNAILYSGGRDGIVCAWDLNLDLRSRNDVIDPIPTNSEDKKPKHTTKFRAQTHAHMHWINDIALAQNNTALVSGSSDLTVKVWRPYSEEDNARVETIGEHADYVKCVTTPPPDMGANWVASGGLDRKICLWDLNGAGKTLEIDVQGEEIAEKGSVYALRVGRNIMASGGPEKTVRLYDPRTGDKVSKLVGHVDNIRAILIDDAGDTILSASADKTVKMWSIKNGRCMYTFTMHDESVWSLFSDDPSLGVFYSSDRSGLVAKTDVRGSLEDMDDGLSLAVAHEHIGVGKVVAAGGHIWTATNRSSINRWEDVDTGNNIQLPESIRHHRATSNASIRPREASPPATNGTAKKEIPAESILRISAAASFPARSGPDPDSSTITDAMTRKGSEAGIDAAEPDVKPIHAVAEETIEGQFGLLKHRLLNDRRRVLTSDTAGDVLLWDLIQCKPIKSFGKQHLEDVEHHVNTVEAVAPWCSIDLSSGNLTVVLEPFNCFDAEVYADELELPDNVEFREDQRISLGKWILRYLFANLIDEEIKRDEAHRQKLNEGIETRQVASGGTAEAAPLSISLPKSAIPDWDNPDQVTPKPNLYPNTPGLGIGLATPGPSIMSGPNSLPDVPENAATSPMTPIEKRASHVSRPSTEREDYFTSPLQLLESAVKAASMVSTPTQDNADSKKSIDGDKDKDKDKDKADSAKSPSTPFGKKKFRMTFGTKKLSRSASQATTEKPAIVEEKKEESESSSVHEKEKEVDDSFFGVIQKIHQEYDRQLAENPDKPVETRVVPSLPNDTPVLKLPPGTKVVIQEETSGGSANLYQGTVEDVGKDADLIEQKAPMWLGDVLLQNIMPFKEPVKVSFVLYPMDDSLPAIASTDGNNRLNANRMLRVRKILSYVAERIEPPLEEPEENLMRPEEYLELYCNEQLLSPVTTLATLRTHLWKGGNDIVLHYKSNGKKEIRPFPPPQEPNSVEPEETQGGSATEEANTNSQTPAQPQAQAS
ncbi:hypothetical protein F53441_8850 [Fusarium austroafricanum]|uniref:WD repeat protein n=1 Tax=Fusarium austroafricanum TaxID=2364996 RepID=A0A8H4NWZ4_9HYPO|nr:hypothetical protein F53441_8850 [Fusarium austroafricanum]